MGNVVDKLNYIKGTKTAIKNALIASGIAVGNSDTFRSYVNRIIELNHRVPSIADIKALFGTHIIALYPLLETEGTTAIDVSENTLNGTYAGVVHLNQTGINFDKAVNFTAAGGLSVYSAGLAAKFSFSEGYISSWMKINDLEIWNAENKSFIYFGDATSANNIFARIESGRLTYNIKLNGNLKSITIDKPFSSRWFNVGFRWSQISGKASLFINGILAGEVSELSAPAALVLDADLSYLYCGWGGYSGYLNATAENVMLLDYAPSDADVLKSVNPIGVICFEGDSRTSLKDWSTQAVEQASENSLFGFNKYGFRNMAVGGDGINQLATRSAVTNAQIKQGLNNILVVWIGVNDSANWDAATEYQKIKDYCLAAKVAGWKVVLCTEIDAPTELWQTMRAALNTLINADHSFADALADLWANSELQDCTDATYFIAGEPHLTAAGYTIVGNTVATAIATLI